MSNERRDIKRVAVVIETTTGEFMTIYSESAGSHVSLNLKVESPDSWFGDEPHTREVERFLNVEVNRIRRWAISQNNPHAQFDYLDLIRKAMPNVSDR